jgi:tRNA(fMet)-specific endonuclease VapC
MTTYILDTNIISLILRNEALVRARLSEALTPTNTILGCPVVWYEVRRGLIARDAKRQIGTFERVFAAFGWQDFNQADWSLATDLWAKRRAAGSPISDADLLIGAYVSNRGATLVTDNEKDFLGLGITIENWTIPKT